MNKGENYNKIPKSFIVALGVALFFWLLTKFSKEYQTVITLPVNYVNIPQDKLIQSEPLKTIDVEVKATGFRLLGINIVRPKIELDAGSLQRKSGSIYYFLIENQRITIQDQISNSYLINHIVQDTIHLNLGQLATKKIPVEGDFDLSYELGYHLTKPIAYKPDSIIVSGPQEQIDTISNLMLQKLSLSKISSSFKAKLAIKTIAETIRFQIDEVEIEGNVDQFTEGSIDLPFEIINLPDSVSVNTFPKVVKIVYQVGLSNFNKINTSSFRVVCDFKVSENNNLNYLIPKVLAKPDFVTSVKLVPAKVEYLIQK